MDNFSAIDKDVEREGADAVLASLREKRASIHPDKNGGEFKTPEEKNSYHFLSEALDHVNGRHQSNQMIPISQLTAIIESVSKGLAVPSTPPALIEKNIKESFRADLGRKYMTPKIGSGIFAGITGFLFTQATALIEHPVVGRFFSSPEGLQCLGVGFIGSVILFIFSWMLERREEARATYLLSEEALHDIYHMMMHESEGGLVEIYNVRRFLVRPGRHFIDPVKPIFSARLSSQIADQILDVQLKRLEDRKAIELIDKPGIDKVYKLNA